MLDYGGGDGSLARHLLDAGFRCAVTYDPFTPRYEKRPDERFGLVTCFETLEHLPDPTAGAASIAASVAEPGIILFSTLLQQPDSENQGVGWWYIAPRNGHVSIYSREALTLLWHGLGFNVASFNANLHVAFRQVRISRAICSAHKSSLRLSPIKRQRRKAGPTMSDTTAPRARLDIISDPVCPYCYMGKRRIEKVLPRLKEQGIDLEVHWHPFQLGPDRPAGGEDRTEFFRRLFGSPEKARQQEASVSAQAANDGLDFQLDKQKRIPNTLDAHRLVAFAAEQGHDGPVMEALFRAYFTEGRDIGDRAVLADIAAENGLDRAAAAAFLESGAMKDDILARDAQVRPIIGGVPSFAMDGRLMFSGAMPVEMMVDAIGKAHKILYPKG